MISMKEEIKQYFIDMKECGHDIDASFQNLLGIIEEVVDEVKEQNQEDEEFLLEVQSKYDLWLMEKEHRNISYGEIAHIQDLDKEELQELYEEIEQELYEEEEK